MKSTGNWILWVIILITLGMFVSSKADMTEVMATPWLSASQALALVGTALLSMSFVLSSRARFLESLFGGMDKVMKVHHIVGGISFLLIINHPLFLAIDAIPNFQIATRYFWLSTNLSYSLGVGALYTLVITLLLTLVIKLPYDLWLKTHDFMGLALLLGSLHVYTISSDVSRYAPLRIWMFGLLGVGFFFIYI
ncbi:ferric reductase-like transmembrane domain-containing protein [Candidatus Shapirobacteria bacterium]|nr:ferric reductase-like transmembrane domain-containing protein [Candidatus Shapirobacteria bacterium]